MAKLAGLAVAVAIVLGPTPGGVAAQEVTRINLVSDLPGAVTIVRRIRNNRCEGENRRCGSLMVSAFWTPRVG